MRPDATAMDEVVASLAAAPEYDVVFSSSDTVEAALRALSLAEQLR